MAAVTLALAACGGRSDATPEVDAGGGAAGAKADGGDGEDASDAGSDSSPVCDPILDHFCVCAGYPPRTGPKDWSACCDGKPCQGTCTNGVCACGDIIGGCQHLGCCSNLEGTLWQCGGYTVCWPQK
ncbi:MAG: hypothetical protein AMXMBFR56_54590 [Polyangiaceae bacterium]